jgi:hypothetical protein
MSVENVPDAVGGRCLLDDVLSYTSPMSRQTPVPNLVSHYVKKIPTWIMAAVLFSIGLWLKIRTSWSIAPQIADALMIASILAVTVDPFLKNKLIDEFAEDVFEHMVGFSHEPEIKHKIREIAFGTHFYQRNYDLRCVVSPNTKGGVSIAASKKLQIINQDLEGHEFKPGWRFAIADNARACRITHLIDGLENPHIETPDFSEKEIGYADGYAKPVKIAPERKGVESRFLAECIFDAPDDYYHPMYFQHPTIGVDITVEAPDGWRVWIGGQADESNRAAFHSDKLYMPLSKVEIHWRKPLRQELSD